jgi:hypothetical protein
MRVLILEILLILLVTSSLMTISEKPIISICISVQLSKCSGGTQCHRVGGSACTDSMSAASKACLASYSRRQCQRVRGSACTDSVANLCQYLYFCANKASKARTWSDSVANSGNSELMSCFDLSSRRYIERQRFS